MRQARLIALGDLLMGMLGVDPIVVFGFRTSGILLEERAGIVRELGRQELLLFSKILRVCLSKCNTRENPCA